MKHPLRVTLGSIVFALAATAAHAGQDSQQQTGADFTPLRKPVSPLSKPLSAIKGDPRVYDTVPPPRNNVWPRIQEPLDRSLGRIQDQTLWELEQIERGRADRSYESFRRREIERFQDWRERELRIDDRQRRLDQLDARARREELDRREYLLNLGVARAGDGALAAQVEADRQALMQARAARDEALYESELKFREGLERPGADRDAVKQQFEQTRRQVREQYERERAGILGY